MVKCYQPDYPRPQFVRRQWVSLNGPWRFAVDDEDRGRAAHWEQCFPADCSTILVPFSYETEASGIADQQVHNTVWYSRSVPVAGMTGDGRRLLLNFEGVDDRALVWVDGLYQGTHTGGYSRFSFDITDAAAGKDVVEVTVCATDSLSTEQPRGKQRYRPESWGCWYVQTSGIWKTVWIETVSEEHLRAVYNLPDVARRELRLEVEAAIPEPPADRGRYSLQVEVSFDGTVTNREIFLLTGATTAGLVLPLGDRALHLWSPETPALYEITYVLLRDGVEVDRVDSYFGLRTFGPEGNRILLNGRPVFLRMVLDQGYWAESGLTPPNEEALRRDIELAFHFGYNGLRKHQKIEDERFLFWCDVLGMMVWSEMPACYSRSGHAALRFTAQWIEAVRQNLNHPSILVWVPFNESWGLPDLKQDPSCQALVNGIYGLTKALDPTRPVVTNDGWEHTVSDLVTIHDYRTQGRELEEQYLDEDQAVLHNRKTMSYYGQMLFADGYAYAGQPVILSEYGGIALERSMGWGYGDSAPDEEAFWERLSSQNEAIDRIPYFCGMCYTQLTDVEHEVNGLVDMARRPKFSEEMEKRIARSNRDTGRRRES